MALVLVGNKCDLAHERQVSQQEGLAVAREWGCPFFESSAKDNVNVEESFFALVRAVRGKNGGGGAASNRGTTMKGTAPVNTGAADVAITKGNPDKNMMQTSSGFPEA